ncbi:MAG TPA: SIS domain-containing protein [Terriglobales bacterium]
MSTNTLQIIEGQYLRDILDQPRALTATLEQLEVSKDLGLVAARLRDKKIKRVVLTGMGASFHALYPLFLRFNECSHFALVVETSELVYSLERWLDPETLIIAASQSGQSAEIVRLLEANRGRAAIVAVTNAVESPLALHANAVLLTKAGAESSVSCKTYTTALMALHLLGGLFCGADAGETREELAQAIPAVASYLAGWRDHVFEMTEELGETRDVFLVGRGTSLAAAGEGGLILKESVRIHAEGMSGAGFRHGPLEMVNAKTFAVIFAGAAATRALQAKLRDSIVEGGGKTCWIAEEIEPGPWNLPRSAAGVRPMLEILPVQLMTIALAADAGIEAGRFTRIPKVTTTE